MDYNNSYNEGFLFMGIKLEKDTYNNAVAACSILGLCICILVFLYVLTP